MIWCLTDVHRHNGATLYLPGSHRYTKMADVPADPMAHMVPFEAAAGSIIVMEGRVWHTSGANTTTDEDRALLFGYYTKPFLRPQSNFTAALAPERQAAMSPVLRYRLGLDATLNMAFNDVFAAAATRRAGLMRRGAQSARLNTRSVSQCVHRGDFAGIRAEHLQPAAPCLPLRRVAHVPAHPPLVGPCEHLGRGRDEAVGRPAVRRHDVAARRQRRREHVGRDVDRYADGHAGLDDELALHVDRDVAEERGPVGVTWRDASQPISSGMRSAMSIHRVHRDGGAHARRRAVSGARARTVHRSPCACRRDVRGADSSR